MESMESLDLALVNTSFDKKEEHLITYEVEGRAHKCISSFISSEGNAKLQCHARRGGCISCIVLRTKEHLDMDCELRKTERIQRQSGREIPAGCKH